MTAGSRHDLLEVSSTARRLSLPFVSVILSRHYISTNQGHQNNKISGYIAPYGQFRACMEMLMIRFFFF